MSLFSSAPKNRRRRRSATQNDSWTFKDSGTNPSRSRKKSSELGDQAHRLNAQIGALESFLAKKTAADDTRRRMKSENILPPPDKARTYRALKKPLSAAERRRCHAERNRNGLHFLFLFCLACGIGWWLIFSGV